MREDTNGWRRAMGKQEGQMCNIWLCLYYVFVAQQPTLWFSRAWRCLLWYLVSYETVPPAATSQEVIMAPRRPRGPVVNCWAMLGRLWLMTGRQWCCSPIGRPFSPWKNGRRVLSFQITSPLYGLDIKSIGRMNPRKRHCLPFVSQTTPSGLRPWKVVISAAVKKIFCRAWNVVIFSSSHLIQESNSRCMRIWRIVH